MVGYGFGGANWIPSHELDADITKISNLISHSLLFNQLWLCLWKRANQWQNEQIYDGKAWSTVVANQFFLRRIIGWAMIEEGTSRMIRRRAAGGWGWWWGLKEPPTSALMMRSVSTREGNKLDVLNVNWSHANWGGGRSRRQWCCQGRIGGDDRARSKVNQ